MFAARIVGLFFVLLTTGCAGLRCAPPGGTAAVEPMLPAAPSVTRSEGQPVANAESPAQPAGLQGAQPAEPPQTGAAPGGTVAVEPMAPPPAPSVARSTGQPAAGTESPLAKAPAKVLARPLPAEQVRKKEGAAQAPAKPQTPPPLDLKSLETRLKETKAIGVFTKLALKNQVDDLLDQFRAYYQGRLKTTLAELRRPYDLLLLKVLALLQDSDPPLAGAIVASREAIWSILADPAKFSAI